MTEGWGGNAPPYFDDEPPTADDLVDAQIAKNRQMDNCRGAGDCPYPFKCADNRRCGRGPSSKKHPL